MKNYDVKQALPIIVKAAKEQAYSGKNINEQKFSEYTYLSKDFNSYKFTNELKNLFDSTIMIKLDLSEQYNLSLIYCIN